MVGQVLRDIFQPHASKTELERFAFRLGLNLQAGIDLYQALKRETASHYRSVMRNHIRAISDRISQGDTLYEALRRCGDFFPPIFVELVGVGELTGRLPETLSALAAHYREAKSRTRAFVSAIFFPLTELVIGLAIVGLFILVFGELAASRGIEADPLGFGLLGRWGFVQYVLILLVFAGCIYLGVRAFRAGVQWIWPLQKFLLRIPFVGGATETLLLGHVAWALSRTLDSGMDVLQAVRLAFRSTNHGHYLESLPTVLESLRDGNSLAESLRKSRAFPDFFLETVENGEISGQLPEALDHLAAQLYEQAAHAWKQLSVVAGWVIWALIAGILIFFIFRLASFYLGALGVI